MGNKQSTGKPVVVVGSSTTSAVVADGKQGLQAKKKEEEEEEEQEKEEEENESANVVLFRSRDRTPYFLRERRLFFAERNQESNMHVQQGKNILLKQDKASTMEVEFFLSQLPHDEALNACPRCEKEFSFFGVKRVCCTLCALPLCSECVRSGPMVLPKPHHSERPLPVCLLCYSLLRKWRHEHNVKIFEHAVVGLHAKALTVRASITAAMPQYKGLCRSLQEFIQEEETLAKQPDLFRTMLRSTQDACKRIETHFATLRAIAALFDKCTKTESIYDEKVAQTMLRWTNDFMKIMWADFRTHQHKYKQAAAAAAAAAGRREGGRGHVAVSP